MDQSDEAAHFKIFGVPGARVREVAEIIIAHQTGSVVERSYNRTDMIDQRRRLLTSWAEFLSDDRIC